MYKGWVVGGVREGYYRKQLGREGRGEGGAGKEMFGGKKGGVMHRKNVKSMTNFFPSKGNNRD